MPGSGEGNRSPPGAGPNPYHHGRRCHQSPRLHLQRLGVSCQQGEEPLVGVG